jgi:hypothetical protein
MRESIRRSLKGEKPMCDDEFRVLSRSRIAGSRSGSGGGVQPLETFQRALDEGNEFRIVIDD